MTWALAFYRVMLRLYPRAFRARFGEEMQSVFAQALENTAGGGWRALARLLVTEIADQPLSAARQHWLALRGWEGKMNAAIETNAGAGEVVVRGGPPTAWSESLLAGLPCLLAGLLQGVPLLLGAAGWVERTSTAGSIIQAVFGGLFVLAILGSFVLALNRRMFPQHPLWAASWYPFWTVGVFLLISLARQVVTGDSGWFPLMDFITYVIAPLGIAYGLYRAARADRLRGLLAALPVMLLLWTITNEFVPDGPEGVVWLGAWLLGALAAVLIARWQRLGAGLALALGVMVVSGFAFARNGIYLGGMLFHSEPGPSLKAVLSVYVPLLTVACSLALGPQLARSLRELGLRGALHGGGWAYRLALAGILVMFVGMLLKINAVINNTGLWGPYPILRPLIDLVVGLGLYPDTTGLTLAGAALYVAGFALAANATRKAGALPGWSAVALLFVALPGAPLTLHFADAFIGFTIDAMPVGLAHALELAWLALAFFTILYWTRSMKQWRALPG